MLDHLSDRQIELVPPHLPGLLEFEYLPQVGCVELDIVAHVQPGRDYLVLASLKENAWLLLKLEKEVHVDAGKILSAMEEQVLQELVAHLPNQLQLHLLLLEFQIINLILVAQHHFVN